MPNFSAGTAQPLDQAAQCNGGNVKSLKNLKERK
jgi:hypothetical protein